MAQQHNWRGGNYFPPPLLLHAERYRSACRRKKQQNEKQWGEEELPSADEAMPCRLLHWRSCDGGRWRCRGSRMMTTSGGATVSSGGESGYCSSLPSVSFPLLSIRFSFLSVRSLSLFGSFSPFWFLFCSFFPSLVHPLFLLSLSCAGVGCYL